MIVEHLINSALASGRLVITQQSSDHYHLKVRFGGAFVTLASAAVVAQEEPIAEVTPVEAAIPEESVPAAPVASAQILAFPGART